MIIHANTLLHADPSKYIYTYVYGQLYVYDQLVHNGLVLNFYVNNFRFFYKKFNFGLESSPIKRVFNLIASLGT